MPENAAMVGFYGMVSGIRFTTLIYVFGMSRKVDWVTKQLIGHGIGIITMENHHL